MLETYGPIYDFNVLKDRATGQSRGCAFVTYSHRETAMRAINDLHDRHTLPGMTHPMQVKPAESENREDQRKIFVGMLPKSLPEDRIRSVFAPYGEIQEVFMMRTPTGESRGCAFVKFGTSASATAAIEGLNGRHTFEVCFCEPCAPCVCLQLFVCLSVCSFRVHAFSAAQSIVLF